MYGKLLILCDELPKDHERYSVKDVYYLRQTMIDPDDNPESLFVCWDAVIPKDRSFIEGCKYYASTYDEMPPHFLLQQTGTIDSKNGNIKGSIQENSYIHTLDSNIEIIRSVAEKGEDYQATAIDLAVQYPMQANQQFLEDLSAILNLNGVIKILPAHSNNTDPEMIRYRTDILKAWQNQNRLMRDKASHAKIIEPMVYEDFRQVYSRTCDEIMKIYSSPIFGEKDETKGYK